MEDGILRDVKGKEEVVNNREVEILENCHTSDFEIVTITTMVSIT
jgi:hypothetical protein